LKKYLHFPRQDKLRDRDAQIEETGKTLSEKQESFSRLEQNLSNCKLELLEKEKRINEFPKIEVFDISLKFKCLGKKLFCLKTYAVTWLFEQANLKQDAERNRKLQAHFKVSTNCYLER
jgi:hypothetical protein